MEKGIPMPHPAEHRAVVVFNPTGASFVTVHTETGLPTKDGHLAWNIDNAPILTDITVVFADWQQGATDAAQEILFRRGWLPAGTWSRGEQNTVTAPIQRDPERSFIRLVVERQERRGVDATGCVMEDIPRCRHLGPDGATQCNLAYNHRFYYPGDRHEFYVPISGGPTLMSWAHTERIACCHYAATGTLCGGHRIADTIHRHTVGSDS